MTGHSISRIDALTNNEYNCDHGDLEMTSLCMFEQDAGYSKDGSYIWSNKVGGDFFIRTVLAAYQLQEHYTEGICATFLDGNVITGESYVGWLNYLFGEKYMPKNFDPWKLFESYYHTDEHYVDWDVLYDDIGYAFIGACEICAVLHGTASALAKYDRKSGMLEMLALHGMKRMSAALQQYASESELDRNAQCLP